MDESGSSPQLRAYAGPCEVITRRSAHFHFYSRHREGRRAFWGLHKKFDSDRVWINISGRFSSPPSEPVPKLGPSRDWAREWVTWRARPCSQLLLRRRSSAVLCFRMRRAASLAARATCYIPHSRIASPFGLIGDTCRVNRQLWDAVRRS
jgi:hypothetical protein